MSNFATAGIRLKAERVNGKTKYTQKRSRPIITRGHAVNLRTDNGFLHLSGQKVTQDRATAWRGTFEQARAMIAQTPVDGLRAVYEAK